jgi:hypothetical protein
MVRYNGGAAVADEDDGCGGWRDTVRGKTDKIAFFMIAATPSLVRAGHAWIRTTEYRGNYDMTLGAFVELFQLADELVTNFVGRTDLCTSYMDIAKGFVGIKNCHAGERKMAGVITMIMNWLENHLPTDATTVWLTKKLSVAALYSSIRNYVSMLLTKLICNFYYYTKNGTIQTWRVIKIIISTTAEFSYNAGLGASSMALALGGSLVRYFSNLPAKLENDVPKDMDVIEENIEYFTEQHENITTVLEAVDNLEDAEEEEGDALLKEYEESDEAEEDLEYVEVSAKIMIDYLENALKRTEDGGDEFYDHQLLREKILRVSGRYDENEETEYQAVSQPIEEDYYDEEMNFDSPLRRGTTYGGIIKKKDIPFIKNLNKSMQMIKKKYKLKKVKKSKKKYEN